METILVTVFSFFMAVCFMFMCFAPILAVIISITIFAQAIKKG